jgi:SNF2 family DNA or RNA helicase
LRRRRSHQGFAQETIETSDENASATHPGAIPTDATLILLPSHLVDQWQSEIGKFLPELRDKVIVMGSGKASHFAKLTIREVLEAKIIIVACDNCTKPPYLKMLANLADLVELAVNWFSPPFTFITRMVRRQAMQRFRL